MCAPDPFASRAKGDAEQEQQHAAEVPARTFTDDERRRRTFIHNSLHAAPATKYEQSDVLSPNAAAKRQGRRRCRYVWSGTDLLG